MKKQSNFLTDHITTPIRSFALSFATAFIHCGILGWCLEILYTAAQSFRRREVSGRGTTSVFMFFIYGMGVFLKPIYQLIRRFPAFLRGIIYMLCIFTVEYRTGALLTRKKVCPWNYERCRFHVNGLIRLDYAPLWFFTGLLFERLLRSEDRQK